MQKIERQVKEKKVENILLDFIGYYSKGVLSFVFENGLLINFKGEELKTIREFLNKLDD